VFAVREQRHPDDHPLGPLLFHEAGHRGHEVAPAFRLELQEGRRHNPPRVADRNAHAPLSEIEAQDSHGTPV
jgi:hypothetical protein